MLIASVILNVVLALALARTIVVGMGWMDIAQTAIREAGRALKIAESYRAAYREHLSWCGRHGQ